MILKGNNGMVELEPERNYTVRDGWRTVRRWRGTKEAVNLFLPTLLIDGPNIRIVSEAGPFATVEASFDNAQDGSDVTEEAQIVTTWSVVSNELEQHVIESDYFDDLNSNERTAIRMYVDEAMTYETALTIVTSPNGVALLEQMNAGKTAYAISQIVLRRSKTVSGYDSAVAYLANANKVYSRAKLIADFAPPAGVQSEMPPYGEWLARNATKEQQSNGKWVITQEWWHGDRISPVYDRV
jgi:hypothetical protein